MVNNWTEATQLAAWSSEIRVIVNSRHHCHLDLSVSSENDGCEPVMPKWWSDQRMMDISDVHPGWVSSSIGKHRPWPIVTSTWKQPPAITSSLVHPSAAANWQMDTVELRPISMAEDRDYPELDNVTGGWLSKWLRVADHSEFWSKWSRSDN